MRKVLLSVLVGGLCWGILAPRVAMAAFADSNIKGTYIASFNTYANDPATPDSVVYPTSAGIAQFFKQFAKDLVAKGNQCGTIDFGFGLTPKDVSTAVNGWIVAAGDPTWGVSFIQYDGAGSLAGGATFNLGIPRAYSSTKDPQALNAATVGTPGTICGGPNAGTLSADCAAACNLSGSSPYNCNTQWVGSSSVASQDVGGGGYCTTATSCLMQSGAPAAASNDTSFETRVHFYYSALGLCPTKASTTFAACCNDPKLDIITTIVGMYSTSTNQSFGVFGDGWLTGSVTQIPQ